MINFYQKDIALSALDSKSCVCVCTYTMCQEQTLCMFYTCKVRTFDKEWTHSRFAVGFSLRFGLVILDNPGIDHKIMGWPESALGIDIISRIILYMNKSPLLVKITYILISASHAKCWPFKYWWSAFSSKVCKKILVRPWWRSYVCVCVCVCMCVCVCVCVHCLSKKQILGTLNSPPLFSYTAERGDF